MFIDDYVSALKRLYVDVKNGIDIGFVEVCVRGIKLPECIAILDIETTGLNEVFDEIVSYGVVRDFDGVVKARVVVRIESDENTLLEHLKSDLKDLKVVYAYYKDFEERFLSKRGFDLIFRDLKRCGGRLRDVVNLDWMDNITGSDVPILWIDWIKRRSFKSLIKIVHHNLSDLMREVMLFIALWNSLENGIDESEWNFPQH